MKKIYLTIILILVIGLYGCNKNETINITIPAGSVDEFVFSDTEILTSKNKLEILGTKDLGDSLITLKPVKVDEDISYEAKYITPGSNVKFDVKKEAWFKIGVSIQNESDEDITVSVDIKNVKELRIEDEDE